MNSILDFCLRYINNEEKAADTELENLEDKVAFTARYARQGAKISKERWAELDAEESILNHRKQILRDLQDVLNKYNTPRYSYLTLDHYLSILNDFLIPYKLSQDLEAGLIIDGLRNQLESKRQPNQGLLNQSRTDIHAHDNKLTDPSVTRPLFLAVLTKNKRKLIWLFIYLVFIGTYFGFTISINNKWDNAVGEWRNKNIQESPTVCITYSGERYHRCYHYSNRNSSLSLFEAVEQGYTPCQTCRPKQAPHYSGKPRIPAFSPFYILNWPIFAIIFSFIYWVFYRRLASRVSEEGARG
jgi:hypothetical protein